MIRQISVFAENAMGTMKHITQVLEDAQINMSILITNDSAEYGIIRMLVNDTDRGWTSSETRGTCAGRNRCWPSRFPTLSAV